MSFEKCSESGRVPFITFILLQRAHLFFIQSGKLRTRKYPYLEIP